MIVTNDFPIVQLGGSASDKIRMSLDSEHPHGRVLSSTVANPAFFSLTIAKMKLGK